MRSYNRQNSPISVMSFFTAFGLAVLGLFCLSILGTFVVRQYNGLFLENRKEERVKSVDSLFAERDLYRQWLNQRCGIFQAKEEQNQLIHMPVYSALQAYQGTIQSLQTKISNNTSFFFLFYENFRKIAEPLGLTYTSKFIDETEGHLHYIESPAKTNQRANKVKNFKALLDSMGIPFLFVMTPTQNTKYAAFNTRPFMKQLDSLGIWSLDLGPLNPFGADAFFKTDIHWTLPTALWATGIIAKEINRNIDFGIDTNLLNRTKFHEKIYPGIFFGHLGRYMALDSLRDNFVYLWPKQEMHYSIMPTGHFQGRAFQEVIANQIFLASAEASPMDDFYTEIFFKFWVRNLDTLVAAKTILVVGDSYAPPIAGFLSIGVQNTIDLSRVKINSCILQMIKPDLVLLVDSPGELGTSIFTQAAPQFGFQNYIHVLDAF